MNKTENCTCPLPEPLCSTSRHTPLLPQAHVAENAPLGTAVLTVRAIDDDLGVNGQITYSLNNETQWRFRIDNDSGRITTAGYGQ